MSISERDIKLLWARAAGMCSFPDCRMKLTQDKKVASDGFPFDPWMRVHARLGAEIIKACKYSMRIEGSVTDWEKWTDMRLPENGEYVIPGALVPIRINIGLNCGEYIEPNVWMLHDLKSQVS